MTINELRDIFIVKQKLECLKRKTDFFDIENKVLAFMISDAQQDIQRRLSVVESSDTITLGSTSIDYLSANTYTLPSNFGKPKHAYIGANLLEEKDLVWLERFIQSGNSGYYYAIKPAGHTSYIICPIGSGTLTIQYYPDLGFYQPSLSASQTWGNFNGLVYSGNLLLPDRYNNAILYKMLSHLFDDYLGLYEKEIKSLRELRLFSSDYKLGYNVGGIDEDILSGGGEYAGTSTVVSSLDEPEKKIRFTATDAGTYDIQYISGWTATPSISVNIGSDPNSIVITSGDSEFTAFVHVNMSNGDFGWSQTGSTIITINPDPTTLWGEVEIIIEIYA